MRGFWIRRRVVVVLALLTLTALIGAYAGIRRYARENADAVSIVVNGSVVGFVANGDVTNGSGTLIPAGPPIKPVERFHYTGAQAREIQRAVNSYSGPDGRGQRFCNPDTREIYAYIYSLTFTLDSVVVESATGDTDGCHWQLSSLGFPSYFADTDSVLPSELRALSNDQIPEPFAPNYA